MKLNEEDLKKLYAQSRTESAQTENCLSEEILRRAAARELGERERTGVVAHLRTCTGCARHYRIAHSTRQWAAQVSPLLESGPGERERGAYSARRSWWRQLLQPLGGRAATYAVLALAIVIISFIAWRTIPPAMVDVPGERGSSNVRLTTAPPDKAALAVVPELLTWSSVESAESYQVTLYDFELTPIWESQQMSATSVQLSESVRAKLRNGQTIYWRITFTTGIERRQSDLFRFTLNTPAN